MITSRENCRRLIEAMGDSYYAQSLELLIRESGFTHDWEGRPVCFTHNVNYCHCEEFAVIKRKDLRKLVEFLFTLFNIK